MYPSVRLAEEGMLKLIAVAGFALAVATSTQAMTPVHQPDRKITQVATGCGAGRTMLNDVCVAKLPSTKRAELSEGVRWSGGTCALYQ
jgi:hypothetical protein